MRKKIERETISRKQREKVREREDLGQRKMLKRGILEVLRMKIKIKRRVV